MAEILFGEIDEDLWIDENPDIFSFLGRDVFGFSEEIEKNGKIEVQINRPGRIEAEICEPGELLPFLVKIVRRDDGWFWDCDCTCNYPCAHLGSLLVKISGNRNLRIFSRSEIKDEKRLEDSELLFEKVEAEKKKLENDPGESREYQLASRHQKYLNLENSTRNEIRGSADTGILVFTLSKGSDGVNRISPGVLRMLSNGKPGKLDDFFAPERIAVPPSPEEQLLLDKIMGSYSKEIPLLPEISMFCSKRAMLYLESEKKFFSFNECENMRAEFRFSDIMKNDDLEFYPVFYPDNGDEKHRKESDVAVSFFRLGDVYISGDTIYCFNGEIPVIHYLKCDPDTRFLVSMMKQSSSKVSSAEINRLKALAAERKPPKLSLDFNLEKADLVSGIPGTVLKMSYGQDECRISFWFKYGQQEIHHSSSLNYLYGGLAEDGRILFLRERNRDYEGLIIDAVRSGFKDHLAAERGPYNRFFMDEEHDLSLMIGLNDFFRIHAPFLMEKEIEIRINGRRIVKTPSISYSVNADQDWFDIRLEFDGDEGEIFIDDELLESNVIQRGDHYIILTTEDIQELIKLQKMGMDAKGFLKTSADNLGVIDVIYEKTLEKENLLGQKKDIIDHLKRYAEGDEPLPDGLNATLREYQEEGFQRLSFWHKYCLNGCLADDMGLGKTVQTLAHLQRLKEADNLSVSLLIAPVVTLPNWEAEASRFAPELKIHRHAGSRRLKSWRKGRDWDLVLVSYNTLRNDAEFFSEFEFDYIILDEAHYVKNAASQTFKAIRSLKSSHRLSLTGTPLENNTMELWTQMNFLNPWLLGPLKEFRNTYARPIEKMGDEGAMNTLRALISPFLLRRRKEDVLDDLPPKEEILLYSEMGEEQGKVYNRMRAALRRKVLDLLESEEGKKSTVEILTFMLKLRQMALLPLLADKRYSDIPSAKMDMLFLLLEDILLENHKVLIFSQFTTVINYLETFCRKRKMKTVSLTGSTRDRAAPVKIFQEDPEIKIFLLSLKAGGVGINLTAADYVILFDPWWNPAAEAQAVDRAHRMGQTRKVFTYRMITRNTIEEKILALQDRKRELADNLISDSAGTFSSLDREDILNIFQ